MTLSIRPRQVLITLLVTIMILAAGHIGQLIAFFYIADKEAFDFIQLLDFDFEGNLPSFYSSVVILLCAVQLSLISGHAYKNQKPFKRHWLGLSLIFFFLALDEATALHEELGDFFEGLALFDASGVLFFAWVVPYSLMLLVFVFSYFKFLWHLPRIFRWGFFGCGALFVAGAVGLEMISAIEADLNGTETIKYSVLYTLEELCEMISMAFFCALLLKYIQSIEGKITFEITK